MKIFWNLGETLKTLKRRRPSRIYCPRCGSPKIHSASSFDKWLAPRGYSCDECGYHGPVVMELEKEEDQD
jgi:predicted RNA-binding Zn-ribbon protein involved in translation (DUF1610 family)